MKDLLDLAMIENNTFKLRQDYFNIFIVIENSFEVVRSLFMEKNVTFLKPSDDCIYSKCFKTMYGDEQRYT